MKPPRTRTLTAEEQLLWGHVAQGADPLQARPRQEYTAPDSRMLVRQMAHNILSRDMALPVQHFTFDDSALLACGTYAGIDRATADRFRKGEMPLDGTLDLHGMTREKAHHRLAAFVQAQYHAGSRFLLVITGKGGKKEAPHTVQGVLREALPGWLSEPGIKPMILTFDTAQARHGGSGAFYILLRRQRPKAAL